MSAGFREPVAQDDVPEPDALRHGGEGGKRGEGLECDLVGRPRHGMEVVEEPDRFGADALGMQRDRDGALPRRAGLPAVVLAGPALRDDDPQLHAFNS